MPRSETGRHWPVRPGQDRPFTADELTAWMLKHGWSVRGLAVRIGVSDYTVRHWRAGSAPISWMAQRAISWANQNTRIRDRTLVRKAAAPSTASRSG